MSSVQNKIDAGVMLPIMEQFYTLQGEGKFTGCSAYFIRVGGCDVGCHWCDVKESWDATIHQPIIVSELADTASSFPGKIAVVTGGEPLMYEMGPLTDALKRKGLRTHIETSGAYNVTGTWDWFCLSPKKTKLPTSSAYASADELKIIIYNKHDFIFAEEQASACRETAQLYLQPEWGKKEEMLPMIIDYIKENPKWSLSLQTHKFLDIP